MKSPIKVVDVFAGPGGLGEGFSALTHGSDQDRRHPFKITISAEMDPVARETLRLRAFYRQFPDAAHVPDEYFDYLANPTSKAFEILSERFPEEWTEADGEALQLELGKEDDDAKLYRLLDTRIDENSDWILVGGPPCQAYSLMGRARNQGKDDYVAEEDHRHLLYREYLKIIQKKRPAVFVMENVKGLLSSTLDGAPIFDRILEDLSDPDLAMEHRPSAKGQGYRLYSMLTGECYSRDKTLARIDPRSFILRAEEYGVPQRRHRIFILGVREDIDPDFDLVLPKSERPVPSLRTVIGDLPPLRSGLSRRGGTSPDTYELWSREVINQAELVATALHETGSDTLFEAKFDEIREVLTKTANSLRTRNEPLERRHQPEKTLHSAMDSDVPRTLVDWLSNDRLRSVANHETRAHIAEDFGRYLFCAAWASVEKHSPKSSEFPQELAPAHKNWSSGKFADRFRVQPEHTTATTITSHISKDGHYFIHYDPAQCRSLTVREAARVQTFPDDYFFMGPRTQQYHQVGNAVPPFLARQIADLVFRILENSD